MFYTLGLKKLPFKQDTRQIIYVESQYDKEINTLIQIHFLDIFYHFDSRDYEFCYLPWQTRKIEEGDEGRYFVPYRNKNDNCVIKSDFILDYMVHPENRKNIQPSLLFYNPDCIKNDYDEAEYQFSGVTISKEFFEKSSDLSVALDNIISYINNHRRSTIRFQKVPKIEFDIDLGGGDDDFRKRKTTDAESGISAQEPRFSLRMDADYLFDTESKVLMDEIIERIEKLNQKGINTYIIKQLINSKDDKLSRLLITKDYRIILKDYKDLEIIMTPLPKAIFLFFLKHPEGIMFSFLPDFREELLNIYNKLKGPLYNEKETRKSVWDVTDPLSNSINEKCSRIRAAFVSQFDERLAKFYYVDGKRGEPKKIALPRELVIWED